MGCHVQAANLRPFVDEAAALMRTLDRCDLAKVLCVEGCEEDTLAFQASSFS